MRLQDFAKIYFAILALHLVTIFKGDYGVLHMLSKPLLLFSLLAFFWQHPKRTALQGNVLVGFALFFSFLGDIFLLSEDKSWAFLSGMGAFAVTHLLMLLFYWGQSKGKLKALTILPLLLGVGLFLVLMNYLTLPLNMELPVNVYAALIIMHLASAFNAARQGAINWWPFAGISLFLISDLLLAYNHFGRHFMYVSMAVMLLYASGQFLIVKGVLEKPES